MHEWYHVITARGTAKPTGKGVKPMKFSNWQKLNKEERDAYFKAYKKALENKKAAKPVTKA